MKTAIKTYLDNRAAEDPQFAARYANPKKSIDECCKYITGEAYAKAKNGTAVLSDEVVYGMAVHYYDEDNIDIKRTPSACTSAPQAKQLSKADREKLQRQAEAEYKDKVAAELKNKELARKAAQKEKAKAKREQEEAMFAGSLFETDTYEKENLQ